MLTELLRLLRHATVWPMVPVADADEAVQAAAWLGFPVVLKSTAPSLEHRTDLGGVLLDLGSDSAVRRAHAEAWSSSSGRTWPARSPCSGWPAAGSPASSSTVEDPLFGPVVTFGVGGVVTELVGDRGYRIPPLSEADAAELVRAPRAAPLLFGHRGAPADGPRPRSRTCWSGSAGSRTTCRSWPG